MTDRTFRLTTIHGEQTFDNPDEAGKAFTESLLKGERPRLTDADGNKLDMVPQHTKN